jgi:hypothetical protein
VFPQTTSQVEQYAARLGQPDMFGGHPCQPAVGAGIPVSAAPSAGRMVKPRLNADELARIKRHLGRR